MSVGVHAGVAFPLLVVHTQVHDQKTTITT